MRIAVIGTGYLGTTHAACMAEIGHNVLGVDIDPGKVAKLQSGEVPFFEPGLENIVKDNLASGRLRFTDSYEEAADFAELHFLTVGTPQCERGFGANLSYVNAAIDALCPHLNRPALIVGKSTVPVGTASRLARRARCIAPAGDDVELAWNPEFLREGFAVHDTLHPDRIVIGVEHRHKGRSEKVLAELYSPLLATAAIPFLITNLATAELAKVAANAFLATKISFINAISEVCEATSADVTVLADAIGVDNRIGRRFFDAGLGFGGGCLPKDTRAFITRADELGLGNVAKFLHVVDDINMRQRSRVVDATREICGSLKGTRVAALGLAFKPNSDDIRDSPALDVASRLQLHGANVTVYDPKAMDNAQQVIPTLNYALSTLDACKGADVVLILTEWDEFRKMRPEELASVTRCKRVIDARNCLDPQSWRAAGWSYRGFGRP
ncbi:UDP-glucose/GDP-mannose dehydrogenase family protein [Mycobacterium sp.]|uniref:UDP-glucose dehydrogenase family protein n=1 Tax=Mycobacterium sp. TaxID=1785 RepID=UPI002CEC3CDD|nr:UDP-glucose/GDP-mannose dehydrogenase family protein [Mycobacterium sp.]HTQ18076.1 UDP-glucose/GDP-mannose dehydrogenase family protein [Mycobacterium sp.]